MRPKTGNFTIGEYYDPVDASSAAVRFSRMVYFNVICRMRPETIHSLTACYNANADVIRYMQAFNEWDFLQYKVDQLTEREARDFENSWYSAEQLTKLRDDLVAWSAENDLCSLEDWVLDIALGQFEQWLWQPRIPHTQREIPNPEEAPYGYWWALGSPRNYAYKDVRFSFSLTNYADWNQEQREKHGPNTHIGLGWDETPFDRLTYNNLQETRQHAKKRILKAFEKALEAHLDETDREADKRGYIKTETLIKRKTHRDVTEPYYWLYHRHFGKLTAEKVANMYGEDRGKKLSQAAVSNQTAPLAKLIGVLV